ncbi:hypothetical protein [uncultured Acetatifactor sp.]|uniref:hypothetical protein n=1 Tax=uncultured Acetatifactor sp. TaxID=1671927 RepID=UPI0026179ED4|nr:hypothetical protein [uncultured Acetatifactor sp.]
MPMHPPGKNWETSVLVYHGRPEKGSPFLLPPAPLPAPGPSGMSWQEYIFNIFSGQKKTKIQLKNMAKDYIIKKSRCKRKVMCFHYDVKSDKKEVPL